MAKEITKLFTVNEDMLLPNVCICVYECKEYRVILYNNCTTVHCTCQLVYANTNVHVLYHAQYVILLY